MTEKRILNRIKSGKVEEDREGNTDILLYYA